MNKKQFLFPIATAASLFCGQAAMAESTTEVTRLKKEIIRFEPYSTYLEKFAPVSLITKYSGTVYISGMPPYDRKTGEIVKAPIREQTEIVCQQLVEALVAAGSSPKNALKCTVYCTSVDYFPIVNEVYAKYFHESPPARVFVNLPKWPGQFDIEIDCVAAVD